MLIKRIQLCNFRKFNNFSIEFGQNINFLVGFNGVGKTSVLEGISVLTHGRSFKTSNLDDTVTTGKEESLLFGEFEIKKTQKNIKVLNSKYYKKIWVDNTMIQRMSDLVGIVDVVVFSSYDVMSFLRSPYERRKMFDLFICNFDHNYLIDLKKYNKLVKEKNKVLKGLYEETDIKTESLLDVLDEQLFILNKRINAIRTEYVESINDLLNKIIDVGKFEFDAIRIKLVSAVTRTTTYSDFLKNRIQDKKNASCHFGIHKDDFRIFNNDMDICIYGSQGQVKLSLILLKLAVAVHINRNKQTNPILVLDDIMGDLDVDKQNELLKTLQNGWQVVISTPTILNLDKNIIKNSNIIEIE